MNVKMSKGDKAVIHIINKFKVKSDDQPFRCIMIYQDLDSEFCFVRPLLQKVELEIIMELFKIFTSYGAPSELHLNSCSREMVEYIDTHMKALCPMYDISFVRKNADNTEIVMKVVQKLQKWMEKTERDEWEIGCSIVQREINTETNPASQNTPHQLFFKGGNKTNINSTTVYKNRSIDLTHALSSQGINKPMPKQVKKSPESPPNILNFSLDSVKVKEEVLDNTEVSIKEHIVEFEGGLILPCFKQETQVEIKLERLDE